MKETFIVLANGPLIIWISNEETLCLNKDDEFTTSPSCYDGYLRISSKGETGLIGESLLKDGIEKNHWKSLEV